MEVTALFYCKVSSGQYYSSGCFPHFELRIKKAEFLKKDAIRRRLSQLERIYDNPDAIIEFLFFRPL
ncbi:MAG: hypothetical protein CVU72_01640 [Deltaproteobacteria bacterium HGW-Deltaproteobacteria-7]|jgi:hypothetical protein|nr:MAG: hypothetical protein CVU72_01640 [Deltaproteobacteria bacterium HGW-Deltaproteobacteria-7]PKN18171.1 MAG: hypothetical protein CVU71_11690 [Deltaproteobacteria bacterium HGW-Deltaproteobacteria-6]